ncbi:uncharacterized protein C8Q71DRAFT_202860 [Rhodofomes roseus]|uniref:Cyclase n=1 Tax=Rhodofomes roseus TaxID=34475 RepID=A0ABQ8KTU9_9APHY|nr:uncharacterized protein C8Q71DRAFT_202860 [Rhodofomes roseus]KAH9842434.1 hypothetical protein C8Q71DRAFT_202860 [Rhodofomes roseus]
MPLPQGPLPSFDELPSFRNFPGCAWDVWGKDDELGTINLLTEDVVREAAKEIKLGKTICLNWPINFPRKPLFNRQPPSIQMWKKGEDIAVHDDSIEINTQSGSQWDGLRHFGLLEHQIFYNNTPSEFFKTGSLVQDFPDKVDNDFIKYGIHNWAQHGICGRGVLLDLVRYYTESGNPLPYDPWTTHSIPISDLEACAKKQGVTFKQGDILILRMGFMQRYLSSTQEERDALAGKVETLAGIEQGDESKRFLWNNHFAAVASDQPTVESWPPPFPHHLHQTLLALWGMPIGEIFDLEALSKACAETGRYTFFFTSWPLNILGGVASPPNAAAYL